MAARNLTLTSIGLPVRTELRLKSMLEVVKNMTVDNWSYSHSDDADLAICEPNSALTTLAVKRNHLAGGTRCALLVKDDSVERSSLPIIHDPVHPTEFLSLLNSISEQAASADSHAAPIRRPTAQMSNSLPVAQNSVFALALALRAAAMNTTGSSVRLEVGSVELLVTPRTKIVMQSKELDAFDITELAEKDDSVAVMEMSAEDAAQYAVANGHRTTIGALLWRLGVFGPRDRLISVVNPDSRFKLKRWPDFGRLEHTADHLRLAARLGRQFVGVAEMAASIGQPIEKVRPFINACILCELALVQAAPQSLDATTTVKMTAHTPAKAESRYKGLFHSIRSALNFAIS